MAEHKVVTTHIRQMLTDACDKAAFAELGEEIDAAVLLEAAAIEARHAAAELETELFKLRRPNVKLF